MESDNSHRRHLVTYSFVIIFVILFSLYTKDILTQIKDIDLDGFIGGTLFWWGIIGTPALIAWLCIVSFDRLRDHPNKYLRFLRWLALIGMIVGGIACIRLYIWMHSSIGLGGHL